VVDQIVAFRHVFRNAEAIDKAVNELLVWDRLTKVVKLRAYPVEVIQVTSQGVAGLDRAVQLCLEGLDVIQRVVLIRVGQGSKGCRAGTVLVTARGACYHVGSVFIFHNRCQQLGDSELIVIEPLAVFTLEGVAKQRISVHQVGLQGEVPPGELSHGVREQKVCHGLELDLSWCGTVVPVVIMIALALSATAAITVTWSIWRHSARVSVTVSLRCWNSGQCGCLGSIHLAGGDAWV
jgi:hypothetical protein